LAFGGDEASLVVVLPEKEATIYCKRPEPYVKVVRKDLNKRELQQKDKMNLSPKDPCPSKLLKVTWRWQLPFCIK
jgi:hypothetical protein